MTIQQIIDELLEKCKELGLKPKELILGQEHHEELTEYLAELRRKNFVRGVQVSEGETGNVLIYWAESVVNLKNIDKYKGLKLFHGASTILTAEK